MRRQNPAVMCNSAHCLDSIILVLEADILQGANEQRVIQGAKSLLQASSTDAQKALESYSQETQQKVRDMFI